MLFRQVALVILAGVLPLAAAGAAAPMTRPWIRKVSSWMLALICYKPAAAAVYAVAFTMIGSGGSPRTTLMGFVTLLLSVLMLPALMKIFTWTTGSIAGPEGGGQLLGAAAMGAVAVGAVRSGPAAGAGAAAQDQAAYMSDRLGPPDGGGQPASPAGSPDFPSPRPPAPRQAVPRAARRQARRPTPQQARPEARPPRAPPRPQPDPPARPPGQRPAPGQPPPAAPQRRDRPAWRSPPGCVRPKPPRTPLTAPSRRRTSDDPRPHPGAHLRRLAPAPRRRPARPRPDRDVHHARLPRHGPGRHRRVAPRAAVRPAGRRARRRRIPDPPGRDPAGPARRAAVALVARHARSEE